jgi:hypothetical protein
VRRIAVSLLLSALLMTFGLALAAPAAACSCAMAPSVTATFASADAVFTGRLVSREVEHPEWPMISSSDPALHVFAVERVFKGTAYEEQGVVSADSGASCGLELSGEGPFLVFATRSADTGEDRYAADLCGGTTTATPELEAALTALAGPEMPEGAGPLPGEGGTDAAGPAGTVLTVVAAGALVLLLVAVGRRRARRRAPSSG